MSIITGRVWKFGNHVDTDQIIPAERLTSNNIDRLGLYIFEKVRPDFASKVKQGDIVVAGRNFGCGSSREHAPRALKQAGISCIVAESFARIFFRNALNIGLVPVTCTMNAEEGDILSIDLENGIIVNDTTSQKYLFTRFPKFIEEIIEAGGLMQRVRRRKGCSELQL